MSPKYKFTKANIFPIFKVFVWSIASAIIATAIMLLDQVDVAPNYLFLVPLANTILFAAKEFISSKQS